MSSISAIPQNPIGGALATALRAGKDVLNYPGKLPASVPLIGGMGAGDMVFGQGPELMEDMSYGFGPTKGAGWATKVDPRVVDLAFAPGVATAASTALRGGKAAAKAAPAMATSEGRRDFIKKAAGLTAGGAAAAMTPDLLTRALKAAPSVAVKEAAPAAAVQVAKTWTPELLKSGVARASKLMTGAEVPHNEVLEKLFMKKFDSPESFKRYVDASETNVDDLYEGLTPKQAEAKSTIVYNLQSQYTQQDIEKALMSGKIPEEWTKQGVTKDSLVEAVVNANNDPEMRHVMYYPDTPDDGTHFFAQVLEDFYK